MPNIETIKLYRGPKRQEINRFITEFIENVAVCCHQYCDQYLDEWGYVHYNLLGNERRIYSLMSAAMHNVTPIHQSEEPVIRRRDRRKTQNRNKEKFGGGRVDLWACCGGIQYFLEFKRSSASLNRILDGTIPKKINRRWKSLERQISEIRSGKKNDDDYKGLESSTYFVGMHIITLYKSSKHKDLLMNDDFDYGAKQILSLLRKSFRRNPDLVLAWIVDDKDKRIIPTEWDEEDEESKWELIPLHLFCFIVEKNEPS